MLFSHHWVNKKKERRRIFHFSHPLSLSLFFFIFPLILCFPKILSFLLRKTVSRTWDDKISKSNTHTSHLSSSNLLVNDEMNNQNWKWSFTDERSSCEKTCVKYKAILIFFFLWFLIRNLEFLISAVWQRN